MKRQKISMRFFESVYQEIKETVGSIPAESGGVLFGCRETNTIRSFCFDPHGRTTGGAYDPDVNFLNKRLREEAERGNEFLGFIHSHPPGVRRLSPDMGNGIGDLGYMDLIFKSMKKIDVLNVPLVMSSANTDEFEIIPFIAKRGKIKDYYKTNLVRVFKEEMPQTVESTEPKLIPWKKLDVGLDVSLMQNTHITCVGIGGAMGLMESMVRCGVGSVTLIDYDRVDASNIITQGYNLLEVGKFKTEVLKERIKQVNPKCKVEIKTCKIEDLNKKQLKKLGSKTDLFLFMTDSFEAQSFGNLLALKHSTPSVYAAMYQGARAAEVSFYIPGVTLGCNRCATAPRYLAYENGFKNLVTSDGSNNFQTQYLNSAIGMIAIAILHNKTEGYQFSNWFGKKWERNLVQFRLNPSYGAKDGEGKHFSVFSENEPRLFGLDAQWLKVSPDNLQSGTPCPDCGGFGDHHKTQEFIELMSHPSIQKSEWITQTTL
ncbi:MAG: ThiF family adenylyltransferase [Bacteroidota bacterium]